MHLRFDPHSQRLRLIEVYDLSRMQVSPSTPAKHKSKHSRIMQQAMQSATAAVGPHNGRSVSRSALVLCHASLGAREGLATGFRLYGMWAHLLKLWW